MRGYVYLNRKLRNVWWLFRYLFLPTFSTGTIPDWIPSICLHLLNRYVTLVHTTDVLLVRRRRTRDSVSFECLLSHLFLSLLPEVRLIKTKRWKWIPGSCYRSGCLSLFMRARFKYFCISSAVGPTGRCIPCHANISGFGPLTVDGTSNHYAYALWELWRLQRAYPGHPLFIASLRLAVIWGRTLIKPEVAVRRVLQFTVLISAWNERSE